MTDTWSERAEAYRESDAHRRGRDLELFAEWAEGEEALDVATGGGHVANRLREAGLDVEAFEREDKRIDFRGWIDRAGTPREDADRARELLADRIEDGKLRLDRGIFKARKR